MSNEFSELHAVDRAFGGHILGAFDSLSSTSGPREFREFMTREAKQKVFRYPGDGPQAFLKNYMQDAKGATTSPGATPARVNTPVLPVAYYGRKPGFVSDDENNDGVYRWWKMVRAENEGIDAMVRMLSVVLTYDIGFIAKDKASLDRLSLAWFAHMSDTKSQNRKDRFKVYYSIAGIDVEMTASIRDPTTCILTNASITDDTGLFYAVTGIVEVATPVMFGAAVTIPDPIRIQYDCVLRCGTTGG